jgi:hypothetical protein
MLTVPLAKKTKDALANSQTIG